MFSELKGTEELVRLEEQKTILKKHRRENKKTNFIVRGKDERYCLSPPPNLRFIAVSFWVPRIFPSQKGEGVAAFKRAGFSFLEETKQFKLRMAARQETKSGDSKGGEKTKEEARARRERQRCLHIKKKKKKKPPYPECTFVLGGFLIALP